MSLRYSINNIANQESSSLLQKDLCCFAAKPFADCHCHAITSAKVPLALYFCGGHYRECSIYQQREEQSEVPTEQSA